MEIIKQNKGSINAITLGMILMLAMFLTGLAIGGSIFSVFDESFGQITNFNIKYDNQTIKQENLGDEYNVEISWDSNLVGRKNIKGYSYAGYSHTRLYVNNELVDYTDFRSEYLKTSPKPFNLSFNTNILNKGNNTIEIMFGTSQLRYNRVPAGGRYDYYCYLNETRRSEEWYINKYGNLDTTKKYRLASYYIDGQMNDFYERKVPTRELACSGAGRFNDKCTNCLDATSPTNLDITIAEFEDINFYNKYIHNGTIYVLSNTEQVITDPETGDIIIVNDTNPEEPVYIVDPIYQEKDNFFKQLNLNSIDNNTLIIFMAITFGLFILYNKFGGKKK